MKIFTIILLAIVCSAFGKDSPAVSLPKVMMQHAQHKITAAKYTTIQADTLVSANGGSAKCFSHSFEFGRTHGIFDMGLGPGKNGPKSSGGDTAHYIGFRPTINIFSASRFALGPLLGGGYIFGPKRPLMTRICNSINFKGSPNVAIAVTQGYLFSMLQTVAEVVNVWDSVLPSISAAA